MNETSKRFLQCMLNEAKAVNGVEFADLTVKLNGIVLRKAELEGSFESVYSKVFERMVKIEVLESGDVTEILGDRGG